jgi:hypothetical protein
MLEEMGHPQPPTATETGNNAVAGTANDSIKHKRSKAVDMHFHWMRDQVQQGQFHITWCKVQGLSTRLAASASTIPLHVTETCNLRICANCPLATATILTVCEMTVMTTTMPLLMTHCLFPFMPSPRPRAAVLRLRASVC